MKKPLLIKGYEIRISDEKNANYLWHQLPEALCKEMSEMTDHGERFSPSSRYQFSCNGVDNYKEIGFGTAKAAVQTAIADYFKNDFRFLYITKLN